MKHFALLFVVALLAGCGHTEYYKAMQEQIRAHGLVAVEEAKFKVEQARADAAKWKAMETAATSDVGRTALGMAVQASELKGGAGQAAKPVFATVDLKPPRDLIDYMHATAAFVGAVGNIAVPINRDNKNAKVQIAAIDAGVKLEESKQNGETLRLTAPRDPTFQYDINTGGGDSVVGNNNTLDRRDQRDCRSAGGQGGSGAQGGAASLGNVSNGAGGPLNLSQIAGAAARAARGGNAGGNC